MAGRRSLASTEKEEVEEEVDGEERQLRWLRVWVRFRVKRGDDI